MDRRQRDRVLGVSEKRRRVGSLPWSLVSCVLLHMMHVFQIGQMGWVLKPMQLGVFGKCTGRPERMQYL